MAINPAQMGQLPEQLKGYRLLERLGRGGFGEVWKVEAPGGFLKAMKFVFGDLDACDEEGRPAEQELKALNRVKSIRHPYILSLERFDIIDGQLIIVMELADRNLWDRFRECRMLGLPGIPREELLRYMSETAEALDLMNSHYQIQHLDIKPQNLFLVFEHIKVADFGLAKAFEGARATVTGGVTPVYAAPETFEGYVSRFSDQYSLGIVFQELLTGHRPFNGANTKQLLLQHLRDAPDVSSLPEHDRAIIAKALNKQPNDRWPTCMEMVKRLMAAPTAAESAKADFGALPLPPISAPKPARTPSPGFGKPGLSGVIPQTMPGSAVAEARAAAGIPAPAHSVGAATLLGQPSLTNQLITRNVQSLVSTPLPGLVTPKLVTQKAVAQANGNPMQTLMRNAVVETGRMGAMGIAPPEKQGDGILMPSLVIGIGQTGLRVIRRLRKLVRDRFGKAEQLPVLRFLYIDTDAEEASAVTSGDDPLTPNEVILAKLNRPAHYLQREGPSPVDQWLPPGMLYQLPKTPGPAAGVRAFGRLALTDNYRAIAPRLRQEIEYFLFEDNLTKAAKSTGLGYRTNTPRVYIVANTAGGTGGGMFLDLAFLLKHELKQVGYKKPEIVGMLMAPPVDKAVSRPAIANTFAALAEVSHFATGQKYQFRFDSNEAPVVDCGGAFDRVAVVPLPKKPYPNQQQKVAGGVARAIYLDLLTPVGKVTDYVRSVTPYDQYDGPVVQPFGIYRLSWPRHEILAAITKRFSVQLLKRWSDKEAAHLREPIQWWLTDQWVKSRLEHAMVIARFEQVVRDSLREAPELVFDAAIDNLRSRASGTNKMDAMAAVGVLEQLLKMIGKPEGDIDGVVPSIPQTLEEAVKEACREGEAQLSEIAGSFIEQPQYRLAGAEESLNQITKRLKDSIEDLERERKLKARDVADTYQKVFNLIGGLNSTTKLGSIVSRKASITAELIDVMGLFARKRYHTLLIEASLTFYRGLLSAIPEILRDVAFCRSRLETFSQEIGAQSAADPAAEPGSLVMPIGCATLDAAADQFISSLPPEDILDFDQSMQAEVEKKFRKLVTVCLKQEKGAGFPPMLVEMAREFLDSRLETANPADALARYRGEGHECMATLTEAFDASTPAAKTITEQKPLEAAILAAPEGPAGDKLRLLMSDANPDTQFIPAPLNDDIVLYREWPRVPIANLQQLGDTALAAYQAQLGTEHPPHARTDIPWVAPFRPAPK
jgi:serine/threonine protein kinase